MLAEPHRKHCRRLAIVRLARHFGDESQSRALRDRPRRLPTPRRDVGGRPSRAPRNRARSTGSPLPGGQRAAALRAGADTETTAGLSTLREMAVFHGRGGICLRSSVVSFDQCGVVCAARAGGAARRAAHDCFALTAVESLTAARNTQRCQRGYAALAAQDLPPFYYENAVLWGPISSRVQPGLRGF